METKNPKSSIRLRFDLINPHAVAYARTHLSEYLGPLKERGREIIQREVMRAMSGQQTPQQVARLIRDNALALTPEQILASDAYWKDLIKKKLDANTINRRMAKFNARQLQERAETIARTEVHRAALHGTLASWKDAARRGTIILDEWVKVWHVTWDERLCDVCEAMDGVAVEVAGEFAPTVLVPDLHPQCRCTMDLIRKDKLEDYRRRVLGVRATGTERGREEAAGRAGKAAQAAVKP